MIEYGSVVFFFVSMKTIVLPYVYNGAKPVLIPLSLNLSVQRLFVAIVDRSLLRQPSHLLTHVVHGSFLNAA